MTRQDASAANRVGPAPDPSRPPRSVAKGDVPEAMLDRYLIERDRQGRPERFFRDHRTAVPMFRDRGGSLVSTQAYPDAVADMLKIARHRGWTQIRVSGDETFRREVWIQAQALGLEVRGHRPRERDVQAAGRDGRRPDPSHGRSSSRPASPDPLSERLARAAVVVAKLIPDPAIQARLLERARTRAEQRRSEDRERPPARDRAR